MWYQICFFGAGQLFVEIYPVEVDGAVFFAPPSMMMCCMFCFIRVITYSLNVFN